MLEFINSGLQERCLIFKVDFLMMEIQTFAD